MEIVQIIVHVQHTSCISIVLVFNKVLWYGSVILGKQLLGHPVFNHVLPQ